MFRVYCRSKVYVIAPAWRMPPHNQARLKPAEKKEKSKMCRWSVSHQLKLVANTGRLKPTGTELDHVWKMYENRCC